MPHHASPTSSPFKSAISSSFGSHLSELLLWLSCPLSPLWRCWRQTDVELCSSSMLTGGVTLGESLGFSGWASTAVNGDNGASQRSKMTFVKIPIIQGLDKYCFNLEFNSLSSLSFSLHQATFLLQYSSDSVTFHVIPLLALPPSVFPCLLPLPVSLPDFSPPPSLPPSPK